MALTDLPRLLLLRGAPRAEAQAATHCQQGGRQTAAQNAGPKSAQSKHQGAQAGEETHPDNNGRKRVLSTPPTKLGQSC